MQEQASNRDLILNLEIPLNHLSCGLNAMELMTLGLNQAQDPYADGIHAIWLYLNEAEAELRRTLFPPAD